MTQRDSRPPRGFAAGSLLQKPQQCSGKPQEHCCCPKGWLCLAGLTMASRVSPWISTNFDYKERCLCAHDIIYTYLPAYRYMMVYACIYVIYFYCPLCVCKFTCIILHGCIPHLERRTPSTKQLLWAGFHVAVLVVLRVCAKLNHSATHERIRMYKIESQSSTEMHSIRHASLCPFPSSDILGKNRHDMP